MGAVCRKRPDRCDNYGRNEIWPGELRTCSLGSLSRPLGSLKSPADLGEAGEPSELSGRGAGESPEGDPAAFLVFSHGRNESERLPTHWMGAPVRDPELEPGQLGEDRRGREGVEVVVRPPVVPLEGEVRRRYPGKIRVVTVN